MNLHSALAGAFAGAVATAVMSAHMLGAPSLERIGTPPPQLLVGTLLPGLREGEQRRAAAAVHVAIGAGAGAAFGMLRKRGGPLAGAVFGVLVWAIGYQAVMPLIGVLPSARRDSGERVQALLEAHLVYGGVLGLLLKDARQ